MWCEIDLLGFARGLQNRWCAPVLLYLLFHGLWTKRGFAGCSLHTTGMLAFMVSNLRCMPGYESTSTMALALLQLFGRNTKKCKKASG